LGKYKELIRKFERWEIDVFRKKKHVFP
jgi:hypothetical protein